MHKITCVCGHEFDLVDNSTPGWIAIPNDKYLDVIDAENKLDIRNQVDCITIFDLNDDQQQGNWDIILKNCASLYRCPDCKRILWREPADGPKFRVYEPTEQFIEYTGSKNGDAEVN